MATKAKAAAKDQGKPVMGRPSKYDPAYCARVIELGAEGKSPEQVAARLGVARQTLYNWADEHPEFLAALEQARRLEQDWWEEAGQKALYADKFQQQVWAKSMQARFREKYTERVESTVQGPNGGPVQIEISVNFSKPERIV